MSKKSNYYFKEVEIHDHKTKRLEELNAYVRIQQIVEKINLKISSFEEVIDYVLFFDSKDDQRIVMEEICIQFAHKLACDFDQIQHIIPKLYENHIRATKVLNKKSSFGETQIKIYYHNDDNDERAVIQPLPFFTMRVAEIFLYQFVKKNENYSEIIHESKIKDSERKNILIETYNVLAYYLKESNLDIDDLIYSCEINSEQENILKRYSKYLTVRRFPHTEKYYYSSLLELFVFYFIHNKVLHSDLQKNKDNFLNLSLEKLPNFLKYVKKNQALPYTIAYFSVLKQVDQAVLEKIWRAAFKPTRGSAIKALNSHNIPEPLINIDNYVPGKNQLTFLLDSYFK